MLSKSQQNFVDIIVKHPKIKQTISSKEEFAFKPILCAIGQEGKDWFHQMPFYQEEDGLVAVCDFCFPEQKLIIELDGKSHKIKNQCKRDIERDKVFISNEYYVLRIKTPIPNEKLSYWKVYIEETLKICGEEVQKEKKKIKTKYRKLFTKKEFEDLLKTKLKD